MCLVHSAGRRRPGHPAGGVPVHSIRRQYACVVVYTVLIMTRALPRKQPRDINTICTTDIMALGDLLGDTGIGYFYMYSLCFAPGPTCRGSASLYVPPLSYKREGTRVGYYTPVAQTTLNPCVFLCSSRVHLAGKTLRPLLILGFRAGAFRHPAGEFPLRHLARQVGV
jgi:hypothetical protein